MTRVPQGRPAARHARSARPARMPALDGLRGAAVLGVLLFHTGDLPGGFLGVDLFFALSGYLITGLLLREAAATGRVSLVAFWGRRVRRLLPALAAMLAGTALLVQVTGPPELVRTTLADGPWVQANLVNWHLLAESAGYWDRFGAERAFEHLWSIAVEEQFYAAWPVLVLLLARCAGRRLDGWVGAAAAAGSAVSVALMIALADPGDPTRVYTGTDTRAFSLLLGALVATRVVSDALARLGDRTAGAAAAVLAAALGAAWLTVDGTQASWLYAGGLPAHSLAAALLIGLCARTPHTAVATALAWRPLRWLGMVSYSLYLWHWPVIVLLPSQGTPVVCAVSVGAAALSTYLVENPVRFGARWAGGWRGVAAFAGVMAGLAVLWGALPDPPAPVVDVTELG